MKKEGLITENERGNIKGILFYNYSLDLII